jgi:hypothetical protein
VGAGDACTSQLGGSFHPGTFWVKAENYPQLSCDIPHTFSIAQYLSTTTKNLFIFLLPRNFKDRRQNRIISTWKDLVIRLRFLPL